MTGIFDVLPAAATASTATAGTMGMSGLAAGLSSLGVSSAATGTLTSMGAAGAAALSGGSGLAALLTTAWPLASASASLFGGLQSAKGVGDQAKANARAMELQSNEEILAAKQEELRGKQDANDILDNLNKTMATNRLAASASGFDVMTGTPEQNQRNTAASANLALSTSRKDTALRSVSRRRQAQELLIQRGITLRRGASDSLASAVSGAGSAANTMGDYYYRGVNRG